MRLHEIINIIESVAPLSSQADWDNSGLQIGSREAEVASVLLCTDISEAILQEALEKHCQLIISHHPLLFHGLKSITGLTAVERCAMQAIQQGIAIYSSHTAMDTYLHGVSGRMAEKIGITSYRILSATDEQRGYGVIGKLPCAVAFESLLQRVREAFHAPVVRYVPVLQGQVQTIALCGGAGSEFVEEAIAQGADVYISADFKYHEFQAAVGRIGVMDIGHFESEQFTKEVFYELLTAHAPQLNVHFAANDRSPIHTF